MKTEKVRVNLAQNSYDIFIGSSILNDASRFIKGIAGTSGGIVITDKNVGALYGEACRKALGAEGLSYPIIEVPAGEKSKSLETASFLYDKFIEHGLDRKSPVIALGGGVVGDLAGFVAATFMRGLPFIQIPTSLLADVDSSVGGKVAVDHPAGKNMIGAFYQPRAVFIDVQFLETLPKEELYAGLAEVAKYGVIWDENFFRFLEENWKEILNLDPGALFHAIKRCVEIKAEVVSEDEKEEGLRAILNFGHTVGHGLERAAPQWQLSHGEAVAAGMIAEGQIAVEKGLAEPAVVERLSRLVEQAGLQPDLSEVDFDGAWAALSSDKKIRQGQVTLPVVPQIGRVELTDQIKLYELGDALASLLG